MSLNALLARFSAPSVFSLVGRKVIAKELIHQSPCTNAPDVPKLRIGSIEDVDADDEDSIQVWVDFDEPHGVVLCDPSELELA